MEIIRKTYKKAVSYGLIAFGIILFIIIITVQPSRLILKDVHDYNQKTELTDIKFPFTQYIKIPDEKLSFLEIRFGNDSINQYQYTIEVTYQSKILFNHTYINETSNIIRVPIDESEIELTPNENLKINIECQSDCKNVKFNLYNIENQDQLEVLYGFRRKDYGLLWYSIFPITIGLTLFPLTKENKK